MAITRATTAVATSALILYKMKITTIETIALHDPAVGGTTIVRGHTGAGVTGIGQAEPLSLVSDAIIKRDGGL